MVNLSDAVFVLTQSVTPPAQPLIDYVIADKGDGPHIIFWGSRLGPQPTADQLAAVTDVEVTAYYVAQAVKGAGALAQEVQALTVAIKTGDIIVGQRVNELYAYLSTVVAALNSLLPSDQQIPAPSLASDITTIEPTPLTVEQGRLDYANVLSKTTWPLG